MLLQLDPDRMAQLGITVGDVAAAVREQNATNPAGRLGRGAGAAGHRSSPCRSRRSGRLKTPEQFDDIVVRAQTRRLAGPHAATSAERCSARRNYDLAGRLNGEPTAPLLLYLRPGANALAVRQAVDASA